MISIDKTIVTAALITVAEAKTQCRVDNSDPDISAIEAELTETILDAVDIATHDTNADVAHTTVVYTDTDFSGQYLTIKEGNFNTLTSVTLDAVDITPDADHIEKYFGSFVLDFEESKAGKLVVTFTTGYADANELPRRLRRALLVKIHDLYDPERSSYTPNVFAAQKTYQYLIAPYVRNYY